MTEQAERGTREGQDVRGEVEAALTGVDQPVVFGPSRGTGRAKAPPRRRRPHPAVVRKPEKGLLHWLVELVVVPVHHLTDPIGNLFDWFLDAITFRRKRRALRGGWGSRAGSLLAAHHTSAQRFLVVGRTGLHLVHIGELGSETGWSLPRDQVRSVEHLAWDGGMPHKATLRFRFADGSWADLVVTGQAWQRMLSLFPPARSR